MPYAWTAYSDEISLNGDFRFNPHFNFVFDIEDGKFREVKLAIENTTLELNHFIYNYEYTEQPGELLKTPVEVQLFWHDDTGEHGNLTFTLSDSDPFQAVTSALFSHGVCVDWDSRSSYEVSTYIVDQEGIESNQVSFVLVE